MTADTEADFSSRAVPPAPDIRTSLEVTGDSIRKAFQKWTSYLPRYDLLWRYYMGYQKDMSEARDGHAFVVTNFCQYIVRTLRGYMVGNKPTYFFKDGDTYAADIVDRFNAQSKWDVDSRIVKDLIIYGRAFELVYLDEHGDVKSQAVSPKDAFVAYAGDIERDSVFGLVRYTETAPDGRESYRFYVYTRDEVQIWHTEGAANSTYKLDSTAPHGFGRVPLIEYANNDDYTGDFEAIMSLQDAYNALQSDRLDDKNAFADAILLLQGIIFDEDPQGVKTKSKALKDIRVLQMPDDGHAEYLNRTMDETNVQILQDHFGADIHKIAMVPDLSDEQFAGNASGVAMAYKLFGTDQIVSDKTAHIQKGFLRRCKLYDTALFNRSRSPGYSPRADVNQMSIHFVYNAVQDLGYMSTAIVQLVQAEVLSRRTAMEVLSIIEDPEEEMKRVESDQDRSVDVSQRMFEDHYTHRQETAPDDAERF